MPTQSRRTLSIRTDVPTHKTDVLSCKRTCLRMKGRAYTETDVLLSNGYAYIQTDVLTLNRTF